MVTRTTVLPVRKGVGGSIYIRVLEGVTPQCVNGVRGELWEGELWEGELWEGELWEGE